MKIHPKVSGAALGSALGVLIVSVLTSIHGITLTPSADAAIPSFLALLGGWLAPGDPTEVTPVTRNQAGPDATPGVK